MLVVVNCKDDNQSDAAEKRRPELDIKGFPLRREFKLDQGKQERRNEQGANDSLLDGVSG